MITPPTVDETTLDALDERIEAERLARTDSLNAVLDLQAKLFVARQVAGIAQRFPDAQSVSLTCWDDEVEEGEPFDVDLAEVYDQLGDQVTDVGGTNGAFQVRHHWVLDDLRLDPEAAGDDRFRPGNRVGVTKTLLWLNDTLLHHT